MIRLGPLVFEPPRASIRRRGVFAAGGDFLGVHVRPHVHIPGVRVPIYWVIILCLLAVAIPAWLGTRGADFLTPPAEGELQAIRTKTETTLPRLATQADAISPHGRGANIISDAPPVQLGDPTMPPALDEYADRAPRGASHLIEIANRLEDENHDARALLAWERVIDSAEATPTEIRAAIEAVARLRATLPPWNQSPGGALPVMIQAGTGKKSAEALEPVLLQAAAGLQRASSGILSVSVKVNAGPDIDIDEGPVPVAIWITGPEGSAHSTDVRSFTVATPESLEHDTHRTLHLLVQGHLRNAPQIKRPPPPPDDGDPRSALDTHITRLQWHTFGRLLNAPGNIGTTEG